MSNIPEGADLDVRNPCLEKEKEEEIETLDYEIWREDQSEKEIVDKK